MIPYMPALYITCYKRAQSVNKKISEVNNHVRRQDVGM